MTVSSTLGCCLSTELRQMTDIRHILLLRVSSKTFPIKASTNALLALFGKTHITREQNVSSYYTALCLSKNTRASPWQLTTHSEMTNAAVHPKRPLFNVTRWHHVVQVKHWDLICTDILLKGNHCTCEGRHTSSSISNGVPLVFCFCSKSGILPPHSWSIYLDSLTKALSWPLEASFIWINGSRGGNATLLCWIII